jgi:hypothetical protein
MSAVAPYLGIAGFVLSIALAAVKGYEIFKARTDRKRDRRAAVDDVWFKTVVLELAVPELRKFLHKFRTEIVNPISLVGVRPYATALIRYSMETEAIRLQIRTIQDLSENVYETISRRLEDLDDAVAVYCPHADDASYDRHLLAAERAALERNFDECFSNCIETLRRLHFALYEGKDPDEEIPRP